MLQLWAHCVLFLLLWKADAEVQELRFVSSRDLGLVRRDGKTSDRHLKDAVSTFFKSPAGQNESSVLVNVTLGTGENVKVLAMDHFEIDIEKKTCGDGKLSLTFRDEETYEDAVDDWEWVNKNTVRNFAMLVSGCPEPDSDLQKWLISNTTFDRAHLTVDFNAQEMTWHDMPLNYTLQWGTMSQDAPRNSIPANEQATQARVPRGLFGFGKIFPRIFGLDIDNPLEDVGSLVNDVVAPATSAIVNNVVAPVTSAIAPIITPIIDTLSGKAMEESFQIPMRVPFPEELIKKETTDGFEFGASCKDCGLKGELKVSGHLMMDMSKENPIQEFWLDVSPGGLEMKAAFAIDVGGTLAGKTPFEKMVALPEITIPAFGIKGLASINPSIAPKVIVSAADIQGAGSISAGISAKFKDDAKARLALNTNTPGSDDPTNWEPDVSQEKLTVDSQIEGLISLSMEVDVVIQATLLKPPFNVPVLSAGLKKIGMEVGVGFSFKVPIVNYSATSMMKLTGDVSVEIGAKAYNIILNKPENEFWTKDIFKKKVKELPKMCKDFKAGPSPPFSMTTLGSDPTTTEETTVPESTGVEEDATEPAQTEESSASVTGETRPETTNTEDPDEDTSTETDPGDGKSEDPIEDTEDLDEDTSTETGSGDGENEQASQPDSTGEPLSETAATDESIPEETIESNGAGGSEPEEVDEAAEPEDAAEPDEAANL
ncbi:putative Paternally-expressed gene 3 protein [Glarea lozoyensis 74030]|uniref:Putative Paternally-expressed gene 3 protein n=1 Tax=Glarea lozoyensis (strain ATCC 74030 / MF5533) TaxID=1104152 RepID=H0ENZ0_GLAL7|nr:putative Paternally-expressed gene 3 protein [Glarea lozoyensis 74030]